MLTHIIQSISHRQILNSHADFTTEFQIALEGGGLGRGASPKGETISIYEDQGHPISPGIILDQMARDGCFGRPFDQEGFDTYLASRFERFGRNNAFSLSLAFFHAAGDGMPAPPAGGPRAPRLCLNILNGGRHAYTNPVLSDFSEFLLVARDGDIETVLACHQAIQRRVKERLRPLDALMVSGNRVHAFPSADNRAVIEFLLSILDALGVARMFDLMIDASASDLWRENRYHLSLTDASAYTSERFRGYWEGLIQDYGLAYLEDPFHERDLDAWQALTASQADCRLIGDNLYASDAERIARGAREGLTRGVVVKPNQAGSVSGVRRAIDAARRQGQIIISSHRSISTEETFLSLLTCMEAVPFIKIGPLETDYSSVVRLNEILRLTTAMAGALP